MNIRVLVPRVRRAVEGVGAKPSLTDDQVKDIAADALGDVILYIGSVFGKQLVVLSTDPATGAPAEYATSEALGFPEQAVIAAQAALNHWFFELVARKQIERIADESTSWEVGYSARMLGEALKHLVAERNKALEALASENWITSEYVSFLQVRDNETSRLVEPWAEGAGFGGQNLLADVRFGTPF